MIIMTYTIIIPYMNSMSNFRKRNLFYVIENYIKIFNDANICIVEQTTSELLQTELLNKYGNRITYFSCDFGEKFHKTKLLNYAINKIDSDVYIMGDADAYVDSNCIYSIKNDINKGSLIYPFSSVNYLSEYDTRNMLFNNKISYSNHGIIITRQTGLVNAFTKKTYEIVGGFDECFTEWGAEDDAFLIKCRRLISPIYRNIRPNSVVYHLFHPKINTQTYLSQMIYKNNRKYCACIKRMSIDDLTDYVNKKNDMNYYINKYETMGKLNTEFKWECTPKGGLTIDTTIYDIDDTTNMSFTKLLNIINEEDGKEYAINFIKNIIFKIPNLTDEQVKELNLWMV